MYQSHFHLSDRPFAFAPNPEHYYPASSIEQAREVVAQNVERASGVTMVMGSVGSGKTLLCQLIANQFSGELPVCMVPGGRLTTREMLLQTILHGLGLPFRGQDESELRFTLTDHVAGQSCHNGILLIIDEADRLPFELLEEVRVLTNLVKDGQQRVRLVLAGAHRLEECVGDPKLESLNQRVVGRLFLDNFSSDETADYVRARINACGGGAGTIFTDDALSTVHRATNGVPRLVNQTCDHALLMAAVANVNQLNKQVIEEAWADLQQLPVPTAQAGAAQHSQSEDAVVEFGSLEEEPNTIRDPAGQLDDIQRVVAELETESNQATRGIDIEGDVDFEDQSDEYLLAPEEVEAPSTLPFADQQASAPTVLGTEPSDHAEHQSVCSDGVVVEGPEQEVAISGAEEETVISDAGESVELTIDKVANPFDEEFAEEEIVIQQFASPSQLIRDSQEYVTSAYSRHLAAQLTAAHPGLRMHPAVDGMSEASAESEAQGDLSYEETGEPFQPLSAYLEDNEIAVDADSPKVTIDFGNDGFDPSDDPVLPEDASEIFAAGIDTLATEEIATPKTNPEYEIEFGSGADIAVVIQDAIAVVEEDEIVPAQSSAVSEPSSVSERSRRPEKKFRTLFSSMRRS